MSAQKRKRIAAGAVVAVVAVVGLWFQRDPGDEEATGISGMSLKAGDRFVIVEVGREDYEVTFVVIRDWPLDSKPRERYHDARFDHAAQQVHAPDGRTIDVAGTRCLYSFLGDSLTVTPIRMRDDEDTIEFGPESTRTVEDIEAYFLQFRSR